MKGRYCVRSTDGFWLYVKRKPDGTPVMEVCKDPAPIMRGRQVLDAGATSFLSREQAGRAMAHFGLYTADDPRRLECQCPPEPWEIVPDPNP